MKPTAQLQVALNETRPYRWSFSRCSTPCRRSWRRKRVARLALCDMLQRLSGLAGCRYINLSDMEALLQRTVPLTPIPVMVDVDDGYGNVLCVVQTVRRLEAAGAAGIMMEDQRSPLGTATAGGVAVISTEAAIGKFKAAADARKDRDFFIIGRTESFWPEGLDSAINRAPMSKQAPTRFF